MRRAECWVPMVKKITLGLALMWGEQFYWCCDGARLTWQANTEFPSDGVYHVTVHSEQGLLFLSLG
jgi:hypothetical protein